MSYILMGYCDRHIYKELLLLVAEFDKSGLFGCAIMCSSGDLWDSP